MGKLISIGEALVDLIKLPGKEPIKSAGGAPANVACAVSNLGQQSVMLTKLGKDANGEFLLETLRSKGVDVNHVMVTDSHATTVVQVNVDKKGQRTFTFDRRNSADLFYSFQELPPFLFEPEDILHFGTVDLVPSLMKEAHSYALIAARKQGTLISFDPNLRFSLWPNEKALKETVYDFLYYADLVKITDEELSFLYPNMSFEAALQQIFKAKVRLILVSRGDKGVSMYSLDKEPIHVAGIHVDVVDTTGAGDALIGAFLAKLLGYGITKQSLLDHPKQLVDALKFANKVASYVCTKPGAIDGFPTLEETKKFKL
jgi:fructokinase